MSSSGYVVTFNSTDTIWSLVTEIAATLDVQSGALTLAHDSGINGHLEIADGAALDIATGATLTLSYDDFIGAAIENIDGDGTLAVTGAVTYDGGGTVTTLNVNVKYVGQFNYQAGEIVIEPGKTLTFSGYATLYNSEDDGDIDGGGTLKIDGSAQLEGFIGQTTATDVIDAGAIAQTDAVDVNGSLTIARGHSYYMVQGTRLDASIVNNAGTLGVSYNPLLPVAANFIECDDFTNTGLLELLYLESTLVLTGTATLGGRITGAGVLQIGADAQITIDAPEITVAYFQIQQAGSGGLTTLDANVTFTGGFGFVSGSGELVIPTGKTLTLANGTLDGDIDGGGIIRANGTVLLRGTIGSTTAMRIVDDGTVAQSGDVTLHGSFEIAAGRSFTIQGGQSFQIFSGASTVTFGGAGASIDIAGMLIEGSGHFQGITNKVVVSGAVTNTGRIFLGTQAAMDVTGELQGAGYAVIERRAYLELDAQSTAAQSVFFDGDGATLGLRDAVQFQSSIDDFDAAPTQAPSHGNAIDLIGFDANATKSFANVSGGIVVNISDGAQSASLHFVGSYNASGFKLATGSNSEWLTY